MRPPITNIPGVFADWNAFDMPMRAANDPKIGPALVAGAREREDEGASAGRPETAPTKPPTERP